VLYLLSYVGALSGGLDPQRVPAEHGIHGDYAGQYLENPQTSKVCASIWSVKHPIALRIHPPGTLPRLRGYRGTGVVPDPLDNQMQWRSFGVGACALGPLERETGLEPATPSLEGWRSSQLSYSRVDLVVGEGFEPPKAKASRFTVCPG
jgi:hypothetical protein